jgi:hypothetical protein
MLVTYVTLQLKYQRPPLQTLASPGNEKPSKPLVLAFNSKYDA